MRFKLFTDSHNRSLLFISCCLILREFSFNPSFSMLKFWNKGQIVIKYEFRYLLNPWNNIHIALYAFPSPCRLNLEMRVKSSSEMRSVTLKTNERHQCCIYEYFQVPIPPDAHSDVKINKSSNLPTTERKFKFYRLDRWLEKVSLPSQAAGPRLRKEKLPNFLLCRNLLRTALWIHSIYPSPLVPKLPPQGEDGQTFLQKFYFLSFPQKTSVWKPIYFGNTYNILG